MYTLNDFESRTQLDDALATQVAEILSSAVNEKGAASIAVSGGSTPKGFFDALSQKALPWDKVTITLADERWVEQSSDASNTQLVHDNLLKNNASKASFFHLKRGELTSETLATLNKEANNNLLPLDVLILGMGEDGHTASLFPCSDEITEGLAADNAEVLMKVVPKTAPHDRISFTFSALSASKNTFLHICGDNKKTVLNQALANNNVMEMPIRAFLQHQDLNTQVYWAQ